MGRNASRKQLYEVTEEDLLLLGPEYPPFFYNGVEDSNCDGLFNIFIPHRPDGYDTKPCGVEIIVRTIDGDVITVPVKISGKKG